MATKCLVPNLFYQEQRMIFHGRTKVGCSGRLKAFSNW